MANIVKTKEIGRGYKILLTESDKQDDVSSLTRYDVVVLNNNNRPFLTASTGCIGSKSGEYWFDSCDTFLSRLVYLDECREKEYHNMYCYSATSDGDTPKAGYEAEWQSSKARASMIEKWMLDLANRQWGEKDKRGLALCREFDIHEIFI